MNFKNIYYYIIDSDYNTGKKRQEISSLYRQALININAFLIFAPIKYKILIENDYFAQYISIVSFNLYEGLTPKTKSKSLIIISLFIFFSKSIILNINFSLA